MPAIRDAPRLMAETRYLLVIKTDHQNLDKLRVYRRNTRRDRSLMAGGGRGRTRRCLLRQCCGGEGYTDTNNNNNNKHEEVIRKNHLRTFMIIKWVVEKCGNFLME